MAKEKLNPNKVPATLFVGVGGIGSDIVKRVAKRCHPGELKNLRFVAMDTNVNDLNSVKEAQAHVVGIQTSSTQSVLDYLKNDDDARLNWFPCNTTLYPKTVSEGAGQVRAISRLALNSIIKNGRINKLYKTIDDLFLKDGEETKQALRVVIVSSAAGGTGSGIAMTIGMLIRDYLHKHYREKAAIVRGFFLLPGVMDTVIPTESERISLRRNGYATIKEVNAFMINASGFTGVRRELERYKDLHIDVPNTSGGTDRLDNLPFDFCFLLDRIDQSQESMETLGQYKEFAAQSLYEQNIGPMQRNAFSMEDNIIKEFANGDNLGRNRFGGIGAAVLRYPYEDIADYIAYTRAMSRIGAGEESQSWLKYDIRFKNEFAEFKKKRAITSGKQPELSEVYVSALENDEQRFGVDIKAYLTLGNKSAAKTVSDRIRTFMTNYENELIGTFKNLPGVGILDSNANILKAQSSEKVPGEEELALLRSYETAIRTDAQATATSRAKAILYTAPNIMSDVQGFHLESLLKTPDGAMHPNAVRYVLYSLKKKLTDALAEAEGEVNTRTSALSNYATGAGNDMFDIGKTKEKEEDLDAAISSDAKGKKVEATKAELMAGYAGTLLKYRDAVIKHAGYDIALKYVQRLNAELESFYGSFTGKVTNLGKAKTDIVDRLKFHKGDTTVYICGEKKYLDRLAEVCPESSEGLLLPDELNADIFEAVKVNAEVARLQAVDPYGDNEKSDIFESVLIGYFRDSVRRENDDFINLNIIKAIQAECQFKKYFESLEKSESGEEVEKNTASDLDKEEYLRTRLLFGNRLASAGIGFSTFAEPRVVKCSTFNKELLDMRSINISTMLESMELSPQASDTVSRYDLRFFNALYNITPDQLSRFRAPEEDDEKLGVTETAGIYYTAYHEYIKKIGPDSTKSASISLHIDKRWDSLTELPEIDMGAHYDEMLKIHASLIYGVIYSMIKTHPSSRYDAKKRIFALEDTEGEMTTLVVSNNTECDEFYEVLDALYRDRASVAKIFEMAKERYQFDVDCNRRYLETSFYEDATTFVIGDGHKGQNSLFEIPLTYYNTLPRAKLDDNELAIMIDSVIAVIEKEVARYEQEKDRDAIVTERLMEQFRLFVSNFENEEFNLQKNSTLQDNRVVIMVLRKVCNKIKELKTFDFEDKIKALRSLV